ncbi:Trimeric LpxA-like protein [Pseudocohnilembus persalinus]|uniref:Trimeric LpxA-like protein n=1 Tax=Pseudocohnilembus persalinus TaxID=266149 RepID=A0A0V0QZD4_PSEPJ|nr:Trimeric LpxA-like protein [Pseudocohnilembus persalinus]|eukprot:KRX07622.1 Trimeric LpxA-like protein [Pseudocohnilembus persalinus]
MIKLRLYDIVERLSQSVTGPLYRKIGKGLAQSGLEVQGELTSDDRLVPSLRCRPHQNTYPALQTADFVAPNASVIGNIKVGEQSSIWYGAILRGELGNISIGNQSVIQDLVQIQPSNNKQVSIGDNVFIGSNSYIGSCTLQNNCFIGMGSTICDGATVESYGIVAAGSVVPEGVTVKSNQIWSGNPAQYLRDITPEEKQVIAEHQIEAVHLARIHAEETEKSFRDIVDELDDKFNQKFEDSEAQAIRKMKELGFPMEFDDEDYIEQRVFLKKANGPKESEFWNKQYDAYEQDLYHFPDSFKQFSENYDRYDEVKRFFEANPHAEAQEPKNKEFEYPTDKHSWTRKF